MSFLIPARGASTLIELDARVSTKTIRTLGGSIPYDYDAERIRYANIPGPLRGVGMAFLITGLMGLAFLGFMGFEFN